MALKADQQPIPKSIAIYAPEYFTVRLKYFSSTLATINASSTLYGKEIKLNNIYRPDGTAHDVNGYDLWAGVYRYNRVIGADVKMSWTYFDDSKNPIQMRVGYEILGDVRNGGGTLIDRAPTFLIGMEKQHFHYVGDISAGLSKISTTSGSESTYNAGNIPYKLHAEYRYNPGQIADAVEDMTENSTFVAFGAAADTPHTIRQWAVDTNGATAKTLLVETQIIYTVQLRELRYDNGMLTTDTT